MIPTIRELAEVINDLVGFVRPGEMPTPRRKIVEWACDYATRRPELVKTFGETCVPPGTMPPIYPRGEEA